MTETAVDRIHAEYYDVSRLLRLSGEISLAAAMDANSRKALLLAAASYFEVRIAEDVFAYCQEVLGGIHFYQRLYRTRLFRASIIHGLIGIETQQADFLVCLALNSNHIWRNLAERTKHCVNRLRISWRSGVIETA